VYVAVSSPECRAKSSRIDSQQICFENGGTVQIFGNDSNKSKLLFRRELRGE
jgi:hypothetical protein